MAQLLQPRILDSKFEYEVEKDGDIYVAGARKCSLNSGKAIWGDLLLDRLDQKEIKIWTPKIINPFATGTRTKATKTSELYVPNIMIAHSAWKAVNQDFSLEEFIKKMNQGILQKYQATMNQYDLIQFFEPLHRHYMDYF